MSVIKTLLQETVILAIRPLIYRQVWGWGTLYTIFVGGYRRNGFWQDAGTRRSRGKLHDLVMELDLSQWRDRLAFFLGRWYDLPTQILVAQVLEKRDQVVDVGACDGMFSLTARYCVGSKGRVYAFEPNPESRKKLYRNIELNQIENIQVFPVALGETEGQRVLYVPYVNSGEASLARFAANAYTDSQYDEIQVQVKVGDALLQEAVPRLIKIDVEGGEVGVLKGLAKLIDRHRPLIVAEYIPQHAGRFGSSFDDIRAIAREHFYKIFKLGCVRISGGYTLQLVPVQDSPVDEPCDILLGHIEDPFIRRIQERQLQSE